MPGVAHVCLDLYPQLYADMAIVSLRGTQPVSPLQTDGWLSAVGGGIY